VLFLITMVYLLTIFAVVWRSEDGGFEAARFWLETPFYSTSWPAADTYEREQVAVLVQLCFNRCSIPRCPHYTGLRVIQTTVDRWLAELVAN